MSIPIWMRGLHHVEDTAGAIKDIGEITNYDDDDWAKLSKEDLFNYMLDYPMLASIYITHIHVRRGDKIAFSIFLSTRMTPELEVAVRGNMDRLLP